MFVQLQPKIILFDKNICSTSTKDNYIQQTIYLFNFNPNYFHSTKITIQFQPKIISFNNKVPGHSKYRHSTKFPVWSPVKYAIFSYITDPVPDHKVYEIKMAPEDRSGRDVTEELTQIVRECVRNEIALQRSGSNPSLLMRTRDLIRKPRGDKFHRPGHRSIVSRSILWHGYVWKIHKVRIHDYGFEMQSCDPIPTRFLLHGQFLLWRATNTSQHSAEKKPSTVSFLLFVERFKKHVTMRLLQPRPPDKKFHKFIK